MDKKSSLGHDFTVPFSKEQFDALTAIAARQGTSIENLVRHSVDVFLDVYSDESIDPKLSDPLVKMELRLLRHLVSSVQLSGQALYFSSLPYTVGPPKARLNDEGLAFHWQRSQLMALELLKPPQKKVD